MDETAPLEIAEAELPVDEARLLAFLVDHVFGDELRSRAHIADHPQGGTTIVASLGGELVGLATLRWRSNNPTVTDLDYAFLHQILVRSDCQRRGIGNTLLEGAEQLARERGRPGIATTVGMFPAYGAAQRLYARRGFVPDGRGLCRGRTPLERGETVVLEHDVILWLLKSFD